MKRLADNLVVACDKTEDTPESAVISPSNGINSCLIHVVLLSMACLLLMLSVVVKYFMKRGLTTLCLLSC